MYQAFNSDDGKLKGVSQEEAEKYEAGLKNPLSRMRFPYSVSASGVILGSDDHEVRPQSGRDHRVTLIAFANLAPLIAEWIAGNKWEMMHPTTPGNRNLWEGYKAAVALIPNP